MVATERLPSLDILDNLISTSKTSEFENGQAISFPDGFGGSVIARFFTKFSNPENPQITTYVGLVSRDNNTSPKIAEFLSSVKPAQIPVITLNSQTRELAYHFLVADNLLSPEQLNLIQQWPELPRVE